MPEPLEMEVTISEDGTFADRADALRLKSYLRLCASQTLMLTVSKPRRTAAQNRYCHLLIGAIRRGMLDAGLLSVIDREAGHQMVFDYFKGKYLGHTREIIAGVEVERVASSRFKDRQTFTEFIDCILSDEIVLALGLDLPSPDEWEERTGERIRSYQVA